MSSGKPLKAPGALSGASEFNQVPQTPGLKTTLLLVLTGPQRPSLTFTSWDPRVLGERLQVLLRSQERVKMPGPGVPAGGSQCRILPQVLKRGGEARWARGELAALGKGTPGLP